MNYLAKKLLLLSFLLSAFASAGFDSALKKQKFLSPDEAFKVSAMLKDDAIETNTNFWKDMLNCLIGILWQSSMIVFPIYLLIRDYPKTWFAFGIFLITTLILKYTWLDRVNKIAN